MPPATPPRLATRRRPTPLLWVVLLLLGACGGASPVAELPEAEQTAIRKQRVEIDNIIYGITKSNYGMQSISKASVPRAERGISLAEQLTTDYGSYALDTGETIAVVMKRKIAILQSFIDRAE